MDTPTPASLLLAEYSRYLKHKRFIDETHKLVTAGDKREIDNILCRYLLSHFNQETEATIRAKANAELIEQKLDIVIPFQLMEEEITALEFSEVIQAEIITFALSFKYPPNTTTRLSAKSTPLNAARVILRYEGMLCRTGSFWGLTAKVWNHLRQYRVEYEGFASPLNYNLPKFFSLFPDTDKVYGSLGNFLTAELSPGVYCANPPYVESIMLTMTQKLLPLLASNKPFTFFVLVPGWLDSLPIQKLMESEHCKVKISLANGHKIYDYMAGKIMSVRFKNLFLVLTNTNLKVNADRLEAAFY